MNIFDIANIAVNINGYELSYAELTGTVFGLLSVWFAAKQNILTWGAGLINILFFFAIFYQVQLYSDMFLQVYFFITSIYGWAVWKKQKADHRPVYSLSTKSRLLTGICIIILTGLLGLLIKKIHLLLPGVFKQPASFPFADTFIAVCSIIATVFLAKRFWENWILWIVVDVVCVFVYFKKGIFFISAEYAVFFGLAVYGLILWKQIAPDENRIGIGKI